MKIVIAGAGEVGIYLAQMLSSQSQDIYIIDNSETKLKNLNSKLDIYTVLGDSKDIFVLEEANVDSSDLFIAATSSEETNLISCVLAKNIGSKRTIARINDYDLVNKRITSIYKEIGVDTIISPVELVSDEIIRLIKQSTFTDDFDFDGGVLTVFGILINEKSNLLDKMIADCEELNTDKSFKAFAILRQDKTIIVENYTEIKKDDVLYFISSQEHLDYLSKICGKDCYRIKNIMILGGSRIGSLTAEKLEKTEHNVTLIEKDRSVAKKIAEKLDSTLVINTDGTDVSALESENIQDMDAFIAVTGDSETNIISSLVAKSHGVKKTISRVENIDYINLSHNVGIDTLINKKIIIASNIFKYVRKGEIEEIATLHGVDGETIEFNINRQCKITSKELGRLNIPKGVKVIGVIRHNKGFIPKQSAKLLVGDKVIVFSTTGSIHLVEGLFK